MKTSIHMTLLASTMVGCVLALQGAVPVFDDNVVPGGSVPHGVHPNDPSQPERRMDPDTPIPAVDQTESVEFQEKASSLMGMEVKGATDQSLGRVEEIAVDVESGKIVQLIISCTATPDRIGNRLIAVPPEVVSLKQNSYLVLDVPSDRLTLAPRFDSKDWNDSMKPERINEVASYFEKESPYMETEDPHTHLKVYKRDSQDPIKASSVIGMDICNLLGENIGSVQDLVLDLHTAKILHVIVNSDTKPETLESKNRIPPGKFHYNEKDHTLILDTTRESLSSAPAWLEKIGSNTRKTREEVPVFPAYEEAPYFDSSSKATLPANPSSDSEYRFPENASEQGQNRPDLDRTAAIRRVLWDNTVLSWKAKNIQIITLNGLVTLAGDVPSDAEKILVLKLASRVVPSEMILNNLAVTH